MRLSIKKKKEKDIPFLFASFSWPVCLCEMARIRCGSNSVGAQLVPRAQRLAIKAVSIPRLKYTRLDDEYKTSWSLLSPFFFPHVKRFIHFLKKSTTHFRRYWDSLSNAVSEDLLQSERSQTNHTWMRIILLKVRLSPYFASHHLHTHFVRHIRLDLFNFKGISFE